MSSRFEILTLPVVATTCVRYRRQFHTATKDPHETVSKWFCRLKKLAEPCQFESDLNNFLLDRFLIGLDDDLLNELCQQCSYLTLLNSLRILQRYEGRLRKNYLQLVVDLDIKEENEQNTLIISSDFDQKNATATNSMIRPVIHSQIRSSTGNQHSDVQRYKNDNVIEHNSENSTMVSIT